MLNQPSALREHTDLPRRARQRQEQHHTRGVTHARPKAKRKTREKRSRGVWVHAPRSIDARANDMQRTRMILYKYVLYFIQ